MNSNLSNNLKYSGKLLIIFFIIFIILKFVVNFKIYEALLLALIITISILIIENIIYINYEASDPLNCDQCKISQVSENSSEEIPSQEIEKFGIMDSLGNIGSAINTSIKEVEKSVVKTANEIINNNNNNNQPNTTTMPATTMPATTMPATTMPANKIPCLDGQGNPLPDNYCNPDTGKILCKNDSGIPLSPNYCDASGKLLSTSQLENFINLQQNENNKLINNTIENFENLNDPQPRENNLDEDNMMKENKHEKTKEIQNKKNNSVQDLNNNIQNDKNMRMNNIKKTNMENEEENLIRKEINRENNVMNAERINNNKEYMRKKLADTQLELDELEYKDGIISNQYNQIYSQPRENTKSYNMGDYVKYQEDGQQNKADEVTEKHQIFRMALNEKGIPEQYIKQGHKYYNDIKSYSKPGAAPTSVEALDNEMKYGNLNYIGPINRDMINQEYTYISPSNWFPIAPHPPVCVTNKECTTCPVMMSDGNDYMNYASLSDWNASRRFTGDMNINIDYIKNVLNNDGSNN